MGRIHLKILAGNLQRRVSATMRRARPARLQRQEACLEAEPWTIDSLELGDGRLQIAGWALPPAVQPERARFLCNGRPFAEQAYPIDRPDLGAFFPQRRGASRSGFV